MASYSTGFKGFEEVMVDLENVLKVHENILTHIKKIFLPGLTCSHIFEFLCVIWSSKL